MRYGFIITYADGPRAIAELAYEAEAAGWDGVFFWDGVYLGPTQPVYDAWIVMAAMAMRTERIRIGAMLMPLSRRRPWNVARETVTLDRLSNGRFILPVGLGALDDGGFGKVGEATDRRERAELLDESLEIVTGLWSGQPFSYQGKHYQIEEMTFVPTPVQQPRIPIWVVGVWPRAKSMGRALRYDGLLPAAMSGDVTPALIAEMAAHVAANRTATTPFDIVMEGRTPGDDPAAAAAQVRPWAEAGATWWLESMWEEPNRTEDLLARIRQGPPRIDR